MQRFNPAITDILMCKAIPHEYNCPHLCAVTDVLADECTATAIETSVGVVLMNVCATVVIDVLIGGTVGAGIDMLMCAEIIVASGAVMDALDCDSSVSSEE